MDNETRKRIERMERRDSTRFAGEMAGAVIAVLGLVLVIAFAVWAASNGLL